MTPWVELAGRPVPWTQTHGGPPFVLLTRVHHYRNLAGEPFPISASTTDANRVAARAAAFAATRGLTFSYRLADLPLPVLRLLRERHLLPEPPVPLAGKKGIKHLVLGGGENSFAWLNEVEHLTWVHGQAGLLPAESLETTSPPPEEDPAHPWARSATHGLLTSHPGRIGPAMAFRLQVHLPALALSRKLGQAHASMVALGIDFLPVIRGAQGQATAEPEPARFWLGSNGGLGRSPGEAYASFLADVQPLLSSEREAQEKCLEKHRKRLEDRVQGSLQALAASRTLSVSALRQAASWVRLGAYVGILDAQIPSLLEGRAVQAQSGHLEVSSGRPLGKEEEDTARASVVRLTMDKFGTRT